MAQLMTSPINQCFFFVTVAPLYSVLILMYRILQQQQQHDQSNLLENIYLVDKMWYTFIE